MKCGNCRWFDGDGLLDDDGTGYGRCSIDPPVWIGPSPERIGKDAWVEWLEDGWQRPTVGVASVACRWFEESEKKRWWEK